MKQMKRADIMPNKARLASWREFLHPTKRERIDTITVITSLCCLVFLFFSQTLWMREERILGLSPIIRQLLRIPAWTDLYIFVVVAFSALTLFLKPQQKAWAIIFPVVFLYWILQDTWRWQPYSYMYAFTLLTIFFNSLNPKLTAQEQLAPLKIMVIGVYFWAGFGKINPDFYQRIFPWFLSAFIENKTVLNVLSHVTPFFELSIGVLLLFPPLRLLALGMAAAMLFVVLTCLGPFGHNWNIAVWPWNVYLFVTTLACFLPGIPLTWRSELRSAKTPLCLASFVLFCFLPLLGQFGWWGALPSFKLYSGNIPVSDVILDPREKDLKLPKDLQVLVDQNRIDLQNWSIYEFNITTTPTTPGYKMHIDGARGICKYLQYPETAKIELHEAAQAFRYANVIETKDLCDKKAGDK